MSLSLEPLKIGKIDAFKDLLGSSDFGGCFCAVWTSHSDDWVTRCHDKLQPNFQITKMNVESGRHTGYLIYQDQDLVGWTGSGPKTSFPFLKEKLGSRLSNYSDDIWSIGCLAIKEDFRGRGLSDAIVQAVIAEARANGATCLEAYPTRPFHEPRVFRGTYQLYKRIGFIETGSEKDGDYEIVLMKFSLEKA
ncbi:MAG: GNAT family N-acetyltransferase [Bdellovibrionota bacterium]